MKALFVHVCLAAALMAGSAAFAQSKSAPKGKAQAEEEMGKIEGTTIARPNGKFLGLTIEGGNWKLTFYNEKKKKDTVDVTRATARWVVPMKSDNERAVLNPGDAHSLVGNRFVRPPYNFRLFITLLRGEDENAEAVENYSVHYTE